MGPRRVEAPKSGAQKGEARKGGEPKISRFFPSPITKLFLSSLASSTFKDVVAGAAPESSSCQMGPPGSHTSVHISGSRNSKHHQNSTKGPPRERRKSENCGRKGKKARKFGPPCRISSPTKTLHLSPSRSRSRFPSSRV